jgi:hypothetical protein
VNWQFAAHQVPQLTPVCQQKSGKMRPMAKRKRSPTHDVPTGRAIQRRSAVGSEFGTYPIKQFAYPKFAISPNDFSRTYSAAD